MLKIRVSRPRALLYHRLLHYVFRDLEEPQPKSVSVYSTSLKNSMKVRHWRQTFYLRQYIPSLNKQRRYQNFDYKATNKYRVPRPKGLLVEGILQFNSQIYSIRIRYLPRSLIIMTCSNRFKLASFVANIRVLGIDEAVLQMGVSNIEYHSMHRMPFVYDVWSEAD